jgi:hypothetical protein
MSRRYRSKKRPCKICRKWFIPDPRLGDRQKTCGEPECQRRWHTRKCSEWNRKNRAYFQAIYLGARLQKVAPANSEGSGKKPEQKASASAPRHIPLPDSAGFPRLPRTLVQEVIGAHSLVIIEYMARQLFRAVKEVIIIQHSDITGESARVLLAGRSRGDCLGLGP